MRRLPVLLLAAPLFLSQAFASPALIDYATVLRAAPSPKARALQALPADTRVDVGACDKAWCFVTTRDRIGYVSEKAVLNLPERPPRRVVYIARPVFVGPYYGVGYGYGFRRGFGRRW